MDAVAVVRWWEALLEEWFTPVLHGHQSRALTAFSLAVARARSCGSGRVAAAAGGAAAVASQRRRFERLLANGRLDLKAAWGAAARGVLALHASRRYLLVLDETPRANDLRAMCIRLLVGRRAIPLASACYALGGAPEPMPQLIMRLMDQVAEALPAQANVTLVMDRGLTWPESVLDHSVSLGWHFVGRIQRQTSIHVEGRTRPCRADALCRRPGDSWSGRGRASRAAGWRELSVVCCWDGAAGEPWLLVSDLPPHAARRLRDYARRTWAEQSFRDDKSSGWRWQDSRVDDPRHAGVLLTVMALATILAIELGLRVVKLGLRRRFDPRTKWRLSVFQLGLRWFAHASLTGACPG